VVIGVRIKECSKLFTRAPLKNPEIGKKKFENFDSKLGFKNIILVQMALNL
jgi:hypothetical protein